MKRVVLVGGSGFVGRYVVRALSAQGHACTVLSRHAQDQRDFALVPNSRVQQCDVYDRQALEQAVAGADGVVSMAGILNERGFSGKGFHKVHVQLVETLLDACRTQGVGRMLHISALNAGLGKSHYLRSKGQAEELLQKQKDVQVTVFRPSVIFGAGDSFFNRFADLLRIAPVMPLACAGARMQPVYVGDVAAAMAAALDDAATIGKIYELGGPQVYSLEELVRLTAKTMGVKRWVVPLSDGLSRLQGHAMGLIPGKPFSMDNYHSLQHDNTTERNDLKAFGIQPTAVEAMLPSYLGVGLRQGRLRGLRQRARR